MNIRLSLPQHTVRNLPVHVEVFADDPREALDTLVKMLDGLAAIDGLHITSAAKIGSGAPVTAAQVKADPSLANQQAHDKAMRLLVDLYRDEGTREKARWLLGVYNVKKFGEIPVEKGPELLARALDIKTRG